MNARALVAAHRIVDNLVMAMPERDRQRALRLFIRAATVRLANDYGNEPAAMQAYAIADEIATR